MPPPPILDVRKWILIAFLAISDQYSILIFWFCSQNDCRRPFWMTENHFRSHFRHFRSIRNFIFHKMAAAAILDDRKSPLIAFLAISDQYTTFFFTKWLPAAILNDQKSLLIAFLAISDQYTTLIFFHKMAAGGHFGWPKITFDRISAISDQYATLFFTKWLQRPFWMTENHLWSYFSPFQISTQLRFFLNFHKIAAGGHFGWPKMTFDCISRHFRSIRNFDFFLIFTKWLASSHFGWP